MFIPAYFSDSLSSTVICLHTVTHGAAPCISLCLPLDSPSWTVGGYLSCFRARKCLVLSLVLSLQHIPVTVVCLWCKMWCTEPSLVILCSHCRILALAVFGDDYKSPRSGQISARSYERQLLCGFFSKKQFVSSLIVAVSLKDIKQTKNLVMLGMVSEPCNKLLPSLNPVVSLTSLYREGKKIKFQPKLADTLLSFLTLWLLLDHSTSRQP